MKKMKAYPKTVSIDEIEKLYGRLLRDHSVVFVQCKIVADFIDKTAEDPEEAEFLNWSSWIHLKGGACEGSPAPNVFDFITEDETYEVRNLKIFDIEWMRRDKELHKIDVI